MNEAPTSLFIGFMDPEAPVICFAGPGMRAAARDPRELFALLRGCEAPAPLGVQVRVASRSAGSAAVFVPNETEENLGRFAIIARTLGEDLLGEDPLLPVESWVAKKPFFSFGARPLPVVPRDYLENRFGRRPDGDPTPPPDQMVRALWAIGRRERALEVLRAACATSTDAVNHFRLGEILALELDRAREAVAHLERACELGPDVEPFFTTLGIVLLKLSDHVGSKRAFARAAELAPDYMGVWANLAQACWHVGDKDEMRRAAERAQALEPGEPLTAVLLAGGSPALD